MKAVLCKELSGLGALVVQDVPSPVAGPGQVVVSVKAAGVNFPDVLIVQGKYQFQPPLPFTPGHEVAGIVKETGEGVSSPKPGDRVIAFTGTGGFAEEVLTDAARCIPMPDGMDYPTGAGLVLAHGTSIYALRDRARLKAGETLLVLGAAGGVGLAAVEIGATIGANVIAAASSDDKLEVCRKRGAAETVNYSSEDLKARVKELTGGRGVDVVYDPVGGSYSEPALRSMAWDGRYLVVGFAAGEIPKVPLNLTLLKSCSIVGVFWGAFVARDPGRNVELLGELLAWWSQGKIAPFVSETYPLERAAEALADVENRKARGKLVLVV
ncbi:MAG: NADPH:quinone oxidoreductase family protein [Actinomycetota bacterium]